MSLWKIFYRAATMRLSRDMAYKWNFIIKFFAVIFQDMIGPLIILLIYTTTSGIPGWTFYEFLLFQGTLTLALGLGQFFFILIPVEVIYNVQSGTFDKFLLKPINTLLYLTATSIDWDALARIFVGVALIIVSLVKLDMSILTWSFPIYALLILMAMLFQYSAMILISAFTFLIVKSWALLDLYFKLIDFARYPSSIYSAGLSFILTFLFPIAVAAFYPVEVLLRGITLIGLVKIILPVIGFYIVSMFLWGQAMKRYTSAGG